MKLELTQEKNYIRIIIIILSISLVGLYIPAVGQSPSDTFQGENVEEKSIFSPPPYILFQDDFNDGNANGWTTYGLGTWTVDNGEYRVDMGSGDFRLGYSLAGNMNWKDFIYEVDVKADLGTDKAIYFRHNGTTAYVVNIVGNPEDHVLLGKHPDTVLAHVDYPNTDGIWYHLKVEIINENIKVSVNDQLLIDYTAEGENIITQGKIGLAGWTGAWGSDVVRFDNVVVRGAFYSYLPLMIRE